MYSVKSVQFYEILDSRGIPTIECHLSLKDGNMGIMSVPSGKSVGLFEAHEKRDTHLKRFNGRGVQDVIRHADKIIHDNIRGKQFNDCNQFDQYLIELDGTDNKSHLGANITTALSGAYLKARAQIETIPLYEYIALCAAQINSIDGLSVKTLQKASPKPMVNVINGGAHADNNLAIQEFMLVPCKDNYFQENIRMMCEIFDTLKNILKKRKLPTGVGDEGGFAPDFDKTTDVLDLLSEAIDLSGYCLGKDLSFALDCASNYFYKNGRYVLDGEQLSLSEYLDYLRFLCEAYPISSIEDPVVESDWEGWKKCMNMLTGSSANCRMIVGDDIFVTNSKRLSIGFEKKAANTVLIKPNQVGTITETLRTISFAKEHNIKTVVSHRSGETNDTFIADLAIGCAAPYVKFGSVSRGERICKYNRLLQVLQ